jgi:hypothetical protein
MSLLDSALSEFNASEEEILAHLAFFEASTSLRPRLNGFLNWEGMDQAGKNLCKAFLGAKIDGGLIVQGLFVRLMGCFESSIRRMVRDCIRFVNEAKLAFETRSSVPSPAPANATTSTRNAT